MGTRLAHSKGLSNTPLLDEVVDAILDSHIRASHTATRTGDAFLKGTPCTDIAIRSDAIGCGVELSLTTFLALQTECISVPA
jgi:hypothetical protein